MFAPGFRVVVTSENELPPLPSKLTGGGPGMVKDTSDVVGKRSIRVVSYCLIKSLHCDQPTSRRRAVTLTCLNLNSRWLSTSIKNINHIIQVCCELSLTQAGTATTSH